MPLIAIYVSIILSGKHGPSTSRMLGLTDWQGLVLLVFISNVIGLVRFSRQPERVFAVSVLTLLATGTLATEQVLANLTNAGVVTLLLIVIATFALERTKALRSFANWMLSGSSSLAAGKTLLGTLFASALMNNTAVVAALLSPVKSNPHIAPSKLLLPLSYVAILGGTLTLVGTSTNLIVSSLLLERTAQGLGFFAFLPVGLCVALACLLVIALTMPHLANRASEQAPNERYFLEAQVDDSSSMIGKTVAQNALRNLDSLFLVEIVRTDHSGLADGESQPRLISPVTPSEVIQAGDKLIFSGDISKVMSLKQFDGLTLFAEQDGLLQANLQEVVIRPGSALLGQSLKSAAFRARFDAAVVAIRREGETLSGKLGEVILQAGDYLVLAVGRDYQQRTNLSKNFFLLNGYQTEQLLTGRQQWLAIGGFMTALGVAMLTEVSLLLALLFYLPLLVCCGGLSVNEIKRRFPLELMVVVVSAISLATAMRNVGLDDVLAELVQTYVAGVGPLAALIAIFLVTMLLTELVTNNAAAALMFPIALALAEGLGVNIMPFVMAVAFGASASFISPYGYQTNLMVFNAGQYRLSDVVKFGLPVSLTYSVVAIVAICVVFPF